MVSVAAIARTRTRRPSASRRACGWRSPSSGSAGLIRASTGDRARVPRGDGRLLAGVAVVVGSPRPCAQDSKRSPPLRADELMVVTITHGHEARRRSYELIADASGSTSAADAGAHVAEAYRRAFASTGWRARSRGALERPRRGRRPRPTGDGLLERVAALGDRGARARFRRHLSARHRAPECAGRAGERSRSAQRAGGPTGRATCSAPTRAASRRWAHSPAPSHPALYDRGWHPTAVCGGARRGGPAAARAARRPPAGRRHGPRRGAGERAARTRSARTENRSRSGSRRRRASTAAQLAAAGAQVAARARRRRVARGLRRRVGLEARATARRRSSGTGSRPWPCCLQTHGAIECAERVGEVPDGPLVVLAHPVSRQAAGYDDVGDASPGQVLDPLHDRLHAPARRSAGRRLRRARPCRAQWLASRIEVPHGSGARRV